VSVSLRAKRRKYSLEGGCVGKKRGSNHYASGPETVAKEAKNLRLPGFLSTMRETLHQTSPSPLSPDKERQ